MPLRGFLADHEPNFGVLDWTQTQQQYVAMCQTDTDRKLAGHTGVRGPRINAEFQGP